MSSVDIVDDNAEAEEELTLSGWKMKRIKSKSSGGITFTNDDDDSVKEYELVQDTE
jgi:hypothetical protein